MEYSNRPNVLADLCSARTSLDSLSTKPNARRVSVRSERAQHGDSTSSTSLGYQPVRHLRRSEVDQLVRAYGGGAKVAELAALFGIHRETVGKHLQARGIDTRGAKISAEEIQEAAALYRQGWSLDRLAKKFGINDGTVRSRLLEVGVVMRARRGGRRWG